jgi:hypothetical protein
MEDEEITVTISVAIKAFANYRLSTTKTKEEIMKDINRIGIDIINDYENYTLTDYEIDDESSVIEELEPAIIEIDNDDEFELPFNEDK